jgi:glutathione S-transferase
MVLNFKELEYKTEWVEYPDLAPTFKSFGLKPNSPPAAEYTSPAVKLADGRYIMDSFAIAQELEKLHPEPSIHIDSPYVQRTFDLLKDMFGGLRPVILPRVPETLLNPRSVEYFERTRAEAFGKPLKELAQSEEAGEKAWETAEKGFAGIKAMLEENEGPFVLGTKPSFADFILAGLFRFMELVDRDGDVYGRTMKYDASFSRLYYECKQWMEKED